MPERYSPPPQSFSKTRMAKFLSPLVAALALEATGVVKPSESTPNTSTKTEQTVPTSQQNKPKTTPDVHPLSLPETSSESNTNTSHQTKETIHVKDGAKTVTRELLHDAGAVFIKVNKGDSIDKIKRLLLQVTTKNNKHPFAYLEDVQTTKNRNKTTGFNIPAKVLQVGQWLPIPIPESKRVFTQDQFYASARLALKEIAKNPRYSRAIKDLQSTHSEEELMAFAAALAQKESLGGATELSRYEPKCKAFSYSHFHILMIDAGLRALKNLGFTEGQTYHPKNGFQLALAYLIERKPHTPLSQLIPNTPDHTTWQAFATNYNGGGWRHANPDYIKDLHTKYCQALKDIATRTNNPTLMKKAEALEALTPTLVAEEQTNIQEIEEMRLQKEQKQKHGKSQR